MTTATLPAAQAAAHDPYYVYRPILDLIGFTEGTDKGDGYNETLGYGIMLDGRVSKGKGTDVVLTGMTLDQVDKLQTRMLKDPDNRRLNSSAIGRYQIIRTTMRSIRKHLPGRYPDTRLFDAGCQDEMACYLLGVRGIDKYLAGRLSEDTLINNLAHEWASIPMTSGKGAYGGQRAAVSPDRVRAVLAAVRGRHAAGQPVREVPVEVEKPVVPEEVEKAVKKQTNGWGWSGVGLGGAGAALTAVAGWPWQTIAIFAGIGVAGGLVALVIGPWIVKRVKAIRAEVTA